MCVNKKQQRHQYDAWTSFIEPGRGPKERGVKSCQRCPSHRKNSTQQRGGEGTVTDNINVERGSGGKVEAGAVSRLN